MKRSALLALAVLTSLIVFPTTALAAPINDNYADATVVTEPLPYSDAESTVDATPEASDPDCGGGPTVWYSYTPSEDLRVRGDTFGSDYDTTLWVGTGSPGSFEEYGCNDDAGDNLQSAVSFDAVSGTTYYFMVGACCGGPDGEGGNLEFHVGEAPPPPTLDLMIGSTATYNRKTGVVKVSGTVDCENGDGIYIYGDIRQRAGRTYVNGYFETFVEGCSSDMAWTGEGQADGIFAGGKAEVEAYAETCDGNDCAFDEEEGTVKIRHE